MSKLPQDDVPPPYSEAGSSAQAAVTLPLEHHLAGLPGLIQQNQEAHASSQIALDLAFISLIIPHIESLLHKIASRPHPPALAELIIVPSAPVAGWEFSGERPKPGEARELVRVVDTLGVAKQHGRNGSDSEGESGHGMSKSNPWQTRDEFDDWGRWGDEMDGGHKRKDPGDWWWSDEVLAARLARHVQPKASKPRTPELAPVEPPKSPAARKSSIWGIFKSPDPVTPMRPTPTTSRSAQDDEPVSMSAKAEEVAFRRENALGVMESKSGNAIVVRVRTRLRR
jgi:hypothetical protein